MEFFLHTKLVIPNMASGKMGATVLPASTSVTSRLRAYETIDQHATPTPVAEGKCSVLP